MKVLSRDEEDAHYQAVLKKGATWGATGLATGSAGALVANRYWAGFRGLTLPLKAFAVTSVATFSLIVGADRGSREYEDKALDSAGVGWEEDTLERQVGIYDKSEELKRQRMESLSARDKMLESFKENKYQIVMGSWAASMIGSFGFIATQPMPFTQKLVQARMYAQGLTVAVILASAALASIPTTADHEDAQSGNRASAMYKFKSGSPHELHERQVREAHRREYQDNEDDRSNQ